MVKDGVGCHPLDGVFLSLGFTYLKPDALEVVAVGSDGGWKDVWCQELLSSALLCSLGRRVAL